MEVIRFKSIEGFREQAVHPHLLENVEIKFSSRIGMLNMIAVMTYISERTICNSFA